MKFRTGLILGFAAGFAASSWVNRPEEAVYVGGDEEATAPGALAGRARRLGQRASVLSLDVVKRARQQIQGRLRDTGDISWN